MKTVANLGCGAGRVLGTTNFKAHEWDREIRVDLDSSFEPDVVSDLRAIALPSDHVDAVWMSHTLEHFTRDEAHDVLKEARRILKPGGSIIVIVPDICSKLIWNALRRGDIERPVVDAPAGTFTAVEYLYGMAEPGLYMGHKWGYSRSTLLRLMRLYFERTNIQRPEPLSIAAVGWKG